MNRRQLAGMTMLSCMLAPVSTLADTLPIDGSYGNKDGCAYARTGESTGSDNFFLMTKDAITTAASYCTVKKVDPIAGKGIRAVIACEAEGEDASDFKVTIAPKGKDAFDIKFDDGTVWGPLKKCN